MSAVMVVAIPCGALAWALAVPASPGQAAEVLPSRLYQVTTETGMPHLEENLRYATTRERRCLAHQDLATAFPVLHHVALADCRLDHEARQDETISYVLACEGGHGTTGEARWRLGPEMVEGLLQVKLGGKNMTFYQRVTATPLGDCPSAAD
jgi:hypothetical protein